MPKENTEVMQLHLDIISATATATVTSNKHAVLIVDRAAWHLTAKLDMLIIITIYTSSSLFTRTQPNRANLAVITAYRFL